MATEFTTPTGYDEVGLSNLMGKLNQIDDLSYQVLGLTNLLDRLETTTRKITAFNIDDLLEDKSILESKIKRNYVDLEGYAYLYLDRDTKTLHLGITDAGYSFALSNASTTPILTINPFGKVGINDTSYSFDFNITGSVFVTNLGGRTNDTGNPFLIETGSPNTKGQIIRGAQYGASYSTRFVAVGSDNIGPTYIPAAYSDDGGDSWILSTEAGTAGIQSAGSLAYNGNVWVVGSVGSACNLISYSMDGISWTACPGVNTIFYKTTSSGVRSIAWSGNMFVAVGEAAVGGGSMAYSTDGINWTSLGTSIFLTVGSHVSYGNGVFVAAGRSSGLNINQLAYSSDGINWTPIYLNGGSYGEAVWNGSYWLMASTNYLYISYDGINWYVHSTNKIPDTAFGLVWCGTHWITGARWGVDGCLAIISSDGSVWSSTGTTPDDGSAMYYDLETYDGTTIIARSVSTDSASIRRSVDGGSTWISESAGFYVNAVLGNRTPYTDPVQLGTPVAPVDQAVNLSEWQWYDSTVLSYVTATGVHYAPNFVSTVAVGTQPYATTSTTLNTNLNADMVDSAHLSTDTTLVVSSDTLIPSEKAIKTYVNNVVSFEDESVFFDDEIVFL
jgi:hypothetical protein